MGSQTSKPTDQQRAPQVTDQQRAPQVTDQQRAPQITDPVHLELKKKIQQLRAISIEYPDDRIKKMKQIERLLLQNKSSQYEAIFHDIFELFSELYAHNPNEFAHDSGLAYHLSEIAHGLKQSHPDIDIRTIFKQSITTFPGQKKIIQQQLVNPVIQDWEEQDAFDRKGAVHRQQ
jgi:hypothetical protein